MHFLFSSTLEIIIIIDWWIATRKREVYLAKWFMLLLAWLCWSRRKWCRTTLMSSLISEVSNHFCVAPVSSGKIQDNSVTILWHWGRRQSSESSGRKIKFRGMHLTKEIYDDKLAGCCKSDSIFVLSSRRRIVSLIVVTMTTRAAVKAEKRAEVFPSQTVFSGLLENIFRWNK